VRRVSEHPVLDVGSPGSFDEHGVTPSAIVVTGSGLRLYYFGWQRGVDVPYLLFAGLAVSNDGGETFARVVQDPILPRISGERVCRSAPSVLQRGGQWEMWYVAADAWTEVAARPVPTYEIRALTSTDGIDWGGRGATAVALEGADEFGLGRPFVCRSPDGFRMWYSVRSHSAGYRIGVATSPDGESWTRCDHEAGIDASAAGWDSEMVCFAAVTETRHGTYLFYNGNGYGETGFGVAALGE
jgi:hypothetical protein